MTRITTPLILWLLIFSSVSVEAAEPQKCPVSAESLSSQVGQKLKVTFQGRAIIGYGCEYENKSRTLKIGIDAGPNPAPSAEAWRQMSNPPRTTWKSLPNDPDKAVMMTTTPNGPLYPRLSYERKGWLVEITVLEIDNSSYGKWMDKIIQLKRIPE